MSGSKGQWIAVGIIVFLLSGALTAGVMLSEDVFPVGVGSEAPDFSAVRLSTGDTVTMTAFENEVVVLNLWATWCPPCVEEMPALQRLHELLEPEGLKVVAVSVDAGRRVIEEFVEEYGLTFDVLHDRSGRIEGAYQTVALPETFVIDREGVILRKEIGSIDWDSQPKVSFFRQLLGTASTPPAAEGTTEEPTS